MKLNPKLLEYAKSMRHDATDAEHLMWQILRAQRFMNLKFRRQHVTEPYIVDFYCHELSLVVELDGGQHNTDVGVACDNGRTQFLEALGLKVIRYWNDDVLNRSEVILEDFLNICIELKDTSP
ncbi:endonuclease domain-containing protein [Acinetobacter bereziniae]|uniref:endonuclease domain-containing protein n=1 Tax=Acinetobacter bereziniae TaxID=106648 RepID=UPI0021CD6A32|nr:endonuclease domain-containing protein [Acinetobacter bereziniae]MCU4543021.1 endonuclease domain-containing protein [Acinetobacter bereziniae]MCU4626887.1 endonuclease domain-containing protein [Acinetobacter bereziniae]